MIYLDHCDLYVVDAAAARGRLGSQTKEALKLLRSNNSDGSDGAKANAEG